MITCYFTTNYLLFVRDNESGFGYPIGALTILHKDDLEDTHDRFIRGISPWHEFAESDGIIEQFEISNPSDLTTTHPELFI